MLIHHNRFRTRTLALHPLQNHYHFKNKNEFQSLKLRKKCKGRFQSQEHECDRFLNDKGSLNCKPNSMQKDF